MAKIPDRPAAPLRVAVSDCLLGSPVRYNGAHKKFALPHEELAGLFEFVGFCPEVAIGLGVPRAPINLVGDSDSPRALTLSRAAKPLDVTQPLQAEAERVAAALHGSSAYVFMRDSPSCGLFGVKVYDEPTAEEPMLGAPASSRSRGVYAQRLSEKLPQLPMEEGGRLFDCELRENFVTRAFAYAHWQALLASDPGAAGLVAFHARYKYLLMAHSPAHVTSAGRQLSDLAGDEDHLRMCTQGYFREFMAGLTKPATRGGHANALAHLQGYVKQSLSQADRAELTGLIEDYRCGLQPLSAPLTLLRHHVQHHAGDYAIQQVYLDPVGVAPL